MPDRSQLAEDVRQIMASTFRMEEGDLADDTSQAVCPRWTSLNHMMLLVALEERFGISFSMNEMLTMTSLPQIVDVLRQRVN